MHSTYDFNYILKLEIKLVTKLLIKALDKKEERKAWEMWLAKYPDMTKETFIPFSEYYTKLTSPMKIESKEEILNKVYDIIKMINAE